MQMQIQVQIQIHQIIYSTNIMDKYKYKFKCIQGVLATDMLRKILWKNTNANKNTNTDSPWEYLPQTLYTKSLTYR